MKRNEEWKEGEDSTQGRVEDRERGGVWAWLKDKGTERLGPRPRPDLHTPLIQLEKEVLTADMACDRVSSMMRWASSAACSFFRSCSRVRFNLRTVREIKPVLRSTGSGSLYDTKRPSASTSPIAIFLEEKNIKIFEVKHLLTVMWLDFWQGTRGSTVV